MLKIKETQKELNSIGLRRHHQTMYSHPVPTVSLSAVSSARSIAVPNRKWKTPEISKSCFIFWTILRSGIQLHINSLHPFWNVNQPTSQHTHTVYTTHHQSWSPSRWQGCPGIKCSYSRSHHFHLTMAPKCRAVLPAIQTCQREPWGASTF